MCDFAKILFCDIYLIQHYFRYLLELPYQLTKKTVIKINKSSAFANARHFSLVQKTNSMLHSIQKTVTRYFKVKLGCISFNERQVNFLLNLFF